MSRIRDERQSKKLCISCEQPSQTQRCRACSRRVEEATQRYRVEGRAKGSRPSRTQVDLVDMKHIGEAWSRAITQLRDIVEHSPMNPRRLDEMRGEPLAQIGLINRTSAEILKREGYPAHLARMDSARDKKKRKPSCENQLQLAFSAPRAKEAA